MHCSLALLTLVEARTMVVRNGLVSQQRDIWLCSGSTSAIYKSYFRRHGYLGVRFGGGPNTYKNVQLLRGREAPRCKVNHLDNTYTVIELTQFSFTRFAGHLPKPAGPRLALPEGLPCTEDLNVQPPHIPVRPSPAVPSCQP